MSTIKIITYATSAKKEPFTDWLDDLDDKTRAIIVARLDRVSLGNVGDHTPITNEITELRIHYGPGYRVYFGRAKKTLVILLIGGDKRSQVRDIAKAKRYWLDYKESLL